MRRGLITLALALACMFTAHQAVAKTTKTAATQKHHKKHAKKAGTVTPTRTSQA
jgi:hypothetical protein